MKRYLNIFLAALFSVACMLPAAGRSYTPRTVPNVQIADARRFVSNPDGIISASAENAIDEMCLDLRNRGLAEVVVLVLDEVDDQGLELFAHNVLNLWGVGGKGADNGLVISVVRNPGDIQFATGYGLEGVLPDALCKRIQTVYMVPLLKAGEWDGGVTEGVRAVYNVLTDNTEELTALSQAGEGDIKAAKQAFIAMLLLFGLIIVVAVVAIAARKKGGGGSNGDGSNSGTGPFGGGLGGFLAGMLLGGGLGGRGGGGFGGGFGGGGFGGGFGGGRSGGGGARTGF